MDKKEHMWIIVIVIIVIICLIVNSKYKYVLPIILVGFSIITFIYLIIWRVKENINLKKYGQEEIIKIEDVIIKEQNIDKYAKILNNNKVDTCDEETLIKKFTIKVSMKTKTQELLENVNKLLQDIGYNFCISEEDILKYDYEFIKIRRENNYSTLRHDTNIIIKILNSYKLEAINIESEKNNNYDINMGIISFDKLEELNELGEYDENIEK